MSKSSFQILSTRGGMPWEAKFNGTETVSELLAQFGKCAEGENSLAITITANAVRDFQAPPARATNEERLFAFQSLSKAEQEQYGQFEALRDTVAAKVESLAKEIAKARAAKAEKVEKWTVRCTASR